MQAEARLGLSLKKENTRPNSTEGGGVVDSVVAGCNHGDSATKRKKDSLTNFSG